MSLLQAVSAKTTQWLRAGLAVPGLLVATSASAQPSWELEPPPGPASCLISSQPSPSTPIYPDGEWRSQEAVVRVKRVFTAADAAPTAEVRFNNGGVAFADAVRSHVANYRLPCLVSGRVFEAVQEMQFVPKPPSPRVVVSRLRETLPAGRWPAGCFDSIKNSNRPSSAVLRRPTVRLPATVLVRLTFSRPDLPPKVETLYDGGQRVLSETVFDNVQAYRMPCLGPADEPVVMQQLFRFAPDVGNATGLNPDVSLMQLLRIVKNVEAQKVRFDFATMGCPFKVVMAPYRPFAANRVREIGRANPDRREFIEWLRTVSIDLPPDELVTAIENQTTVSIPCALLDLT